MADAHPVVLVNEKGGKVGRRLEFVHWLAGESRFPHRSWQIYKATFARKSHPFHRVHHEVDCK